MAQNELLSVTWVLITKQMLEALKAGEEVRASQPEHERAVLGLSDATQAALRAGTSGDEAAVLGAATEIRRYTLLLRPYSNAAGSGAAGIA